MNVPKDEPLAPHPLEEGVLHPFTPGEPVVWRASGREDPLVGQRIGEFLVRRRLGSGGMSVVYLGEHALLGRKVAIKLLRPGSRQQGPSGDMEAEARALSAIRHRGIVDIFGFGSLPEVGQYLIMEYLEGQSLDALLQQHGALRPAYALRLLSEVLAALSAAHGVGVIHRDLKPGNIFIVREPDGAESVKVLDFGLAKQAEVPHGAAAQTRAEFVLGTAEYMAPEQACGLPVSPRTDLYAVGVILFEMLTGQQPFLGDALVDVAYQQVNAAPPTPSSLVQGLPPGLEALVLRLLAKKPEQRPASALQVLGELEALHQAPPPGAAELARHATRLLPKGAAAPPGVPQRAARWYTRPLWQRALGAGCAVVAILLGIAIAALFHHPPAAPTSPPRIPSRERPSPEPGSMASSSTGAYSGQRGVGSDNGWNRPAEPGTAGGWGRLRLVSACWSYVYVDGTLRGRAPLMGLALPEGTHLLELRGNPSIEDVRTPISIREGQSSVFVSPCEAVK